MSRHDIGEAMVESRVFARTHEQSIALDGLTGFINAGGRGTRLQNLFAPGDRGVCKALLRIGQPPITLIEHQINKLDHAGVPIIVTDVGDHIDAAEHVRSTYGDRDDVHAVHYTESFESGGGLVRTVRSRPELFANEVFICCVDVLLDIDEPEFLDFHRKKGGDISIALTTGSGVPNEGAYFVDDDGQVMYCAETNGNDVRNAPRGYAYRGSSTGAIIANVDFIRDTPWLLEDGPMSLYRDDRIIPRAIGKGSMFAFNNGDRYFTDVGTIAGWNNASENHATTAPYIHYVNQS